MSDALASTKTLDLETMWRTMRQLVERVFGALAGAEALDDCLDVLVDVLGADRGLVLLKGADGGTVVVNARGGGKALSVEEREEMSRQIIRRALETGEGVVWDPLTASRSSASVTMLGILAAMAAPLHGVATGRDQPRGVLYVDFRDPRKFVTERHAEFFMASAALIGALLEQHRLTLATSERLSVAVSHSMEARRMPPLEDLLAPASMQAIRREVESALRGDAPVLISGESGTGKTLLAHAIAEASGKRPIVRAVLGSSDDLNTIASELFGHERGAFSGATARRMGLAEFANGGTMIFDEILNLPPHAQQLLLDFTQFGTYRPLGYDRPEPKQSSVRIIAATNGDLHAAIRAGRLREDLYYRLAAVTIELPPCGDAARTSRTLPRARCGGSMRRGRGRCRCRCGGCSRRPPSSGRATCASSSGPSSGRASALSPQTRTRRCSCRSTSSPATSRGPRSTRRSACMRGSDPSRSSGRSCWPSGRGSSIASSACCVVRSPNRAASSPTRPATSVSPGRRSRAGSRCSGSARSVAPERPHSTAPRACARASVRAFGSMRE